jgi:hypothetical protein
MLKSVKFKRTMIIVTLTSGVSHQIVRTKCAKSDLLAASNRLRISI